jgi:hypothetical protein
MARAVAARMSSSLLRRGRPATCQAYVYEQSFANLLSTPKPAAEVSAG